MKSKTKRWIISGVAVTAIFSSLSIPQVQAGASHFLSLFRVNQIEMVKLTQSDIQEIENWLHENKEGSLDLKGVGKLNMSGITDGPTYFETSESAKEAGYHVPTLEEYEAEGVNVIPASTITFTLHVEKANQLLTQLGSKHQFEASLNEKPFSVTTYDTIKTDFVKEGNYLSYMQTKSPEINVPNGVSVAELKATLLSLPFLPENVKTQFAGIDHIENTLPIPVVETEGTKIREIRLGKAQGIVVEREQESSIVWQENGNFHVLVSHGKMTADELIQLSLQMK
ncbi:DUF4367 domain-containing protein [Bacillus nitroreducens]